MKNSRDRRHALPCFPLLHRRDDELSMLPGELLELQPGDEVLFCGLSSAKGRMEWILKNYNILYYILTGEDPSFNLLSRILKRF